MNPLSKICLGIGLAVAFVIAVAFLYLVIVNAHLKTQLAESQANDTACHMANGDFVTQIAHQNAAIEDMRTDALQRERNANAAETSARKIAQFYSDAAQKLAARKATSDLCVSTKKIIDDYLGQNK